MCEQPFGVKCPADVHLKQPHTLRQPWQLLSPPSFTAPVCTRMQELLLHCAAQMRKVPASDRQVAFFGLRRLYRFDCLANARRRFWSWGVAIHNTRQKRRHAFERQKSQTGRRSPNKGAAFKSWGIRSLNPLIVSSG